MKFGFQRINFAYGVFLNLNFGQ